MLPSHFLPEESRGRPRIGWQTKVVPTIKQLQVPRQLDNTLETKNTDKRNAYGIFPCLAIIAIIIGIMPGAMGGILGIEPIACIICAISLGMEFISCII